MITASTAEPAAVFRRMGLRVRGSWRPARAPARYEGLDRGARLRSALEELGPLYAAFGQFLAWRADLLRPDYLAYMRRVRAQVEAVPRDVFAAVLRTELGEKGEQLAASLQGDACWSTLWRCAYRARWEERDVVVQVARDPLPDSAFDSLGQALRRLDEEHTRRATSPEALDQFREWARLADSHARERSYLQRLGALGGETIAAYPRPIEGLCTDKVLAWHWVEGETAGSLINQGSAAAVARLSEAVLEQLCILSVVDADLDLEAIVVTGDGKAAYRRANRLLAVPAGLSRTVLQYISVVLAGDVPFAARLLLKLARGASAAQDETRLLDEISGLEPDLKMNLRFPRSAAIFEGNWRALRHLVPRPPLFLDGLHRNLVGLGYASAETAGPGAVEAPDCIADAQWQVVSRLLGARLRQLVSIESTTEWVGGSGLLFFESLRQMNRLAAGLRDNELSLAVQVAPSAEENGSGNAAVRSGVVIGILLILFLLCLRSGATAREPYSGILLAAAAFCGAGLFWAVFRFGWPPR